VVPESIDQAVTLDNLSGGEQEQLYLATRLALAEVLGRGSATLVLDDVLTATDTGRLARVMNVSKICCSAAPNTHFDLPTRSATEAQDRCLL